MSSDRNFSSSQDPDASSQLCADVKTETSGRGMELHVKQEETLESNVYHHGDDFDNTPEVISIKEEEADSEFYLYCEFCKSHFFNKCEVHGPALFIPDTPVPLGVTDRARQTLPPGLEIRNSDIPDAGLGVFNNGEIVPVGAHFGPYQGELVDREDAMNSRYSWVISRRGQCEKYVDAKREMHANWMRYVNCARNKGEQNLMAFMYQGGILYRCCRAVDPGEELLVWYEEEYAKDLGHTFDCLWSNKYFANDFSGGLEGEEASLLAAEQVQFDTVCHGGSEEDLDAENLCLDAEEDAPPRKRLRAENTWKKVINKKRRMVGKAYTGKQKQKEIMREPRAIGPRCSSAACAKSAKHHCSAISEPERNSIFNYFWQHMTWEEKRMYVHGLIDVVPVQRRRGAENSRRSNSLMFFLRVSGQRRRVCKSMFLSTLGIGEWSAVNWAKEGYTQADTEGQTHSNARRSVAGHEFIRSFLQDLPKVPSHYCRSSTSKQYLEPVFQSMADLYAVYCRVAAEKNVTPLSRQVFADEFKRLNLDIYHRKKDQCNICCAFKTGNLPDDEWQHHLLQKEEACTEKLSDKCKASNKIMVICMDLQALLLCPKLKAPELYYKTKLAVHNFTVYNMLTHSATCYVWHEGEGSLSASEFASCIVDYLSAHTEPDTFILWSDGCGYQTRNAVLSNALLLFSMKKNKVVIQKYLEKGHSQMECDSVHSVIERRLRDQDVYLPAEYVNLMKRARVKPHPYEVKYIDHTFFQDFTKLSLCKSLHPGVRPGDLTVHDIRAIRYNNNGTMDLKINHSDDWRPHPSQELRNSTSDSQTVTPLYSDSLKITELKFKHLQDLKEVIPKDFHSFYDNLLH